jgi:hypothetical protein
MFPVSLKGTFELRPLNDDDVVDVLDRVEQVLADVKASRIVREGSTITFRGGFLRGIPGTSINVLGEIGRGELEVMTGDPGRARYRLSTLGMTLTITGVVAALSAFIAVRENAPAFAVWFFVLGTLAVVSMNFVLASMRAPAFLQRAASAPPLGEGPEACSNCATRYDPAKFPKDATTVRCKTCGHPVKR